MHLAWLSVLGSEIAQDNDDRPPVVDSKAVPELVVEGVLVAFYLQA